MLDANRQHHLALPERNRVDQRGLDLFRHCSIVALDQSDLGRHLHGNRPRQLQVVNLFLKTIAQLCQILRLLRVLRQSAFFCAFDQLRKLLLLYLLDLFFSGKDVHGKLFIIGEIQLIHLIQHCRILQQLNLVSFQHLTNFIHINFCFGIFCFHICDLIAAFFEQSEEALFLVTVLDAL